MAVSQITPLHSSMGKTSSQRKKKGLRNIGLERLKSLGGDDTQVLFEEEEEQLGGVGLTVDRGGLRERGELR